MTDEDKPFGELGDLVEALIPVAAALVEAVHPVNGTGPDGIRGVLLQVPKEIEDRVIELPGGTMGVLAVVLAAMVDPEARMTSLLGWAELMIPNAVDRELARLKQAGVRSEYVTAELAEAVAERQQASVERMLHVVHGERTA